MENTTTPAATPNHKIGDIANGHVLTEQGWLPIGTPAPTRPQAQEGPQGAGRVRRPHAQPRRLHGDDQRHRRRHSSGADGHAFSQRHGHPHPRRVATPSETESTPEAEATPEQTVTKAQENALRAAESYLDTMAFSKAGLIDQLSSEYGSGFDKADAKWAVAQLDVDWNEQAVRAGESYLDTMPFSRQGLIDQLSSEYGSQFTKAQATYAVDQMGL